VAHEIEAADSLRLAYSRQSPAAKLLKTCKAQLRLATRSKEEDPARVWLELVSVRETAATIPGMIQDDPHLKTEVERFRAKLEAEIFSLTQEVGDEVIAPLYVWVDLVRKRNKLTHQIEEARQRVQQARAARSAGSISVAKTEEDAMTELTQIRAELAFWKQHLPPPPDPQLYAMWDEEMRASMPQDPATVRERGVAATSVLSRLGGRRPGEHPFPGSRAELILLPALGAAVLLTTLFAISFSVADAPAFATIACTVAAVIAWGLLIACASAAILLRRRLRAERQAILDLVWYWVFYKEQTEVVELEVGWVDALLESLKERRHFDERKGEGAELAELARWRPDLVEFVGEVAALGERRESMAPPATVT
jgi:hypothetical protein